MNKNIYIFSIIVSILFLSGCAIFEDAKVEKESERVFFSCSGSTTISLDDYCRQDDSNTVLVLVANRNLNQITGIDAELQSLSGNHSVSESIIIDMDERKIVEVTYPTGFNPESLEFVPEFLTRRGIETCRPEALEFENIRRCAKSDDEATSSEESL